MNKFLLPNLETSFSFLSNNRSNLLLSILVIWTSIQRLWMFYSLISMFDWFFLVLNSISYETLALQLSIKITFYDRVYTMAKSLFLTHDFFFVRLSSPICCENHWSVKLEIFQQFSLNVQFKLFSETLI